MISDNELASCATINLFLRYKNLCAGVSLGRENRADTQTLQPYCTDVFQASQAKVFISQGFCLHPTPDVHSKEHAMVQYPTPAYLVSQRNMPCVFSDLPMDNLVSDHDPRLGHP